VQAIDGSQRHLYVSVNCPDPTGIAAALRRADERGVPCDVLHFGEPIVDLRHGRMVGHDSTRGVLYPRHQARHLAVVSDGMDVVWAVAQDGSNWQSLSGPDYLLAALAKGFIRHDIYVQQIWNDFHGVLQERYGPGMQKLVGELAAAPRGDFGASIRHKRPAMALVLEHLWPATVELALAAALLSTLLAVPLGIVSATHKDGAADHVSRLASLLLQSMPGFWLGLLLILLFAVELHGLLPAYGSGSWRHLILPAIALAAAPLAQNTRLVRAGMLEVLQQDFIRTARAKGVPERRVLYRHAFRNSAIPFLTVTGLTVTDFHLLVRLKVFNTEQMNQAVFAFRRYEDASLRYTGIESHQGLTHYGLYDTVVAKE